MFWLMTCVSLSSQRTIDQLEFSVAKAMEIFGKCYIKVQFDKNKMPYAFVQFEVHSNCSLAFALFNLTD
jgi:hypothetical protein